MTRKNTCARSPKTTAVVFALLMLAPVFPLAAAEHAPDQLPDFVLPHVEPGDDCIPTGLSLELFNAVTAVQKRDGAYFARDKEVPVLCTNGQPQRDYVNLIERLDQELEAFRAILAELQSQYETRQERALPEGGFLPPRVTLLDDVFDGNRTGGIGDWTIVTATGDSPTWELQQKINFSVMEGAYRFGDDTAYPRGAREFLISPEVDLRAARGNDQLKQTLDFAKAETKAAIRNLCTSGVPVNVPMPNGGQASFDATLGFAPATCRNTDNIVFRNLLSGSSFGNSLATLYEREVDELAERVPVGQEIAKLQFRYRMNLADTQDGVRVWIYTGDQAPDRIELFKRDFGVNGTRVDCGSDHVDNRRPVASQKGPGQLAADQSPLLNDTPPNCFAVHEGGYAVPLEGSKRTGAFSGSTVSDYALTGFTYDYVDVEVDLSKFVGKRVWVLFEAATTPDENQGNAYFSKAVFPEEQARYGFELERLNVTADAWPRNVRLHELTQPIKRTYVDEEGTLIEARTILPPGDEPALLHVLNGGIYRENATVTVDVFERLPAAPVGSGTRVKTYTYDVHDLAPADVRTLEIPWMGILKDERHYDVVARMVVHEFPSAFDRNDATSPNSTNARFPNSGQYGSSSANFTFDTVRSFVQRELVPVNAAGTGFPIEVCESQPEPETACSGLFAAKKGTPRVLRIAVRNDGNAPETAIATLHLTKDGADTSDAVLDGTTRNVKDILPSEKRELTWSLGLNDPGVYNAQVTFQLPDGRHVAQPVERMIFVQQTTGLVCFDDFNLNRECGPAFTSEVPIEMGGVNLTAVAIASNGTLYATSEITHTSGALYARYPGAEWVRVERLDNRTLSAKLETSRPDLGFGTIRDITFAPDGWTYLTGDNATALRWATNGTLESVPLRDIGAAPLRAYGGLVPGSESAAGTNMTAYIGVPFLLSGGSTGGVGVVNYSWTAYGGNASNVTLTNADQRDATANVSRFGAYSFAFNATDEAGTTVFRHVNVTVRPSPVAMRDEGPCGTDAVLVANDTGDDAAPAFGPASAIRCVRMAHNGDAFRIMLDVAGQDFDTDLTKNLTYLVNYTNGAKKQYINVTWDSYTPRAWLSDADGTPKTPVKSPSVEWWGDTLVVTVPRAMESFHSRTELTHIGVVSRGCDATKPGPCTLTEADVARDPANATYKFALADSEYPQPIPSWSAQRLHDGAVRVDWAPTKDNQTSEFLLQYLVMRAPADNDTYTIVANLTKGNYSWVDANVTPGRVYSYRMAAQDPSLQVSQPSSTITVSPRIHDDFRDATLFNGTVHVVAARGQLHRVNDTELADGKTFAELMPINLTVDGKRFTGELHAIAANATHAYVGGDDGLIFVHDGKAWNLTKKGDTLRFDGKACNDFDKANATCRRTITALTIDEGRVFATGTDGLTLTSTNLDTFARLPDLPLVGELPDFQFVFETHLGSVFFVTENRDFWECDACATSPSWVYHAASVPYVLDDGGFARPADLTAVASAHGTTALVGDGGLIMGFQDVSIYGNEQGWSPLAPLIATYGGAVQTDPTITHRSAWRGLPDVVDTTAREPMVRVTLNHYVVTASPSRPVEVRLVHAAQPATSVSTLETGNNEWHSCPTQRPSDTAGGPSANATEQTGDFCYKTMYASSVRAVYTEPSTTAGWTTSVIEFPMDKPLIEAGDVALDLFADRETFWSIDDVTVELVDTNDKGEETTRLFMSYFGPNAPTCTDSLKTRCNKGTWAPTSLDYAPTRDRTIYGCNEELSDACQPRSPECPEDRPSQFDTTCGAAAEEVDLGKCPLEEDRTTVGGQISPNQIVCRPHTLGTFGYGLTKWKEVSFEAADTDPISAWHVSRALADRPVWALNDEVWPHAPGGSRPHLRDNWNMRLVSPVIDLRNAYDPVLEFRHLYAFRTLVSNTMKAVDAGRVEVQYLATGDECGPGLPATHTCWSGFYPLEPIGGYPNASDMGYTASAVEPTGVPTVPFRAYDGTAKDEKANAYWGRTATINEQGFIGDIADTSNYELARFRLSEYPRLDEEGRELIVDGEMQYVNRIVDDRGEAVNLSGRLVRVAFHGVTFHGAYDAATGERQSDEKSPYNHTANKDPSLLATYGGEGWYITDVKVQGAGELGVDLVARDLHFAVGYEVDRVGIGPGQTVPVNVTVSNSGVFDALGYTGELEVRRVIDPILGSTRIVDTISLSQQPALAPGGARNHTFFWDVPTGENRQYVLRATITPIGLERDEDWTDNAANIGSIITPVPARTTKEFHVEFEVTPENATSDITRYVPVYLVNTGNVPLTDFSVRRIINELPFPAGSTAATSCTAWNDAARPKPTVDCREWTTEAPVPAGTRVALGSVDADFEPVEDLFWKAPARATYTLSVEAASATSGLRSVADKRVSAFATFLFDDIEAGVKGESISGEWNLTGGWAPSAPGFRSSESYAFGDTSLARYPADADAVALTPIVDLSNARNAQLAFYHKYDFESVFDGGLIEASVDGGKTWTPLDPVKDARNGLPGGYSSTPMIASSPLHPDGDPTKPLHAFTGSSSSLPLNTEGWILSQFDLTQYAGITRFNVPYEALDLAELDNSGYNHTERNGKMTYLAPRWEVGSISDYRYWEVENLTEDRVANRVGDPTYWWSGSASLADDGVRPAENLFLHVPVDLRDVPKSSPEVVEVEWWEWQDRTALKKYYITPGPGRFPGPDDTHLHNNREGYARGAFTWTPIGAAQTWRLNVTEPQVVERDGHWYRMVATLNDEYKGERFDLTFVYSTAKTPGATVDKFRDDPGFAIDGFTVRKYRTVNGQPTDVKVLLDEKQAWNGSFVSTCSQEWGGTTISTNNLPCHDTATGTPHPRFPVPATKPSWTLRDESAPSLPTFWYVTEVKDETGSRTLPTGEPVKAFYTGDVACVKNIQCDTSETGDYARECHTSRRQLENGRPSAVSSTCIAPTAESRLVTPAIDLGIVAGENAELVFEHRFAFHNDRDWLQRHHPLGSGGVIEIQEFDAQTGEWGPWKQVFNETDSTGTLPSTLKSRAPACCFGYTGYTANRTASGNGGAFYLDPPFEPIYNETQDQDFMYMFTGVSGVSPGGAELGARILPEWRLGQGWIESRFDVSDYIGKKVRFGFHYFLSGESREKQGQSYCISVDPARNICEAGWWVRDVAVRGNVLAGEPIQLRMRAATDGSVNEGGWLVDDIGLFGSRYENNVGVFVDESQAPFGAVKLDTAQIPVTVRNLGTTVRRDLAVEVIQLGNGPDAPLLEFSSPDAPRTMHESEVVRLFRVAGIDLAPGASTTFTLNVTVPENLGGSIRVENLLFVLKEFNSNANQYTNINDNEVQGFLQAQVPFTLMANGLLTVEPPTVLPADAVAGDTVTMRVPIKNRGYTPATVHIECKAETVDRWIPADHTRNEQSKYGVAAAYPCDLLVDGERVSGSTSHVVEAGETLELVYETTPTVDGFLRFTLDAKWEDEFQKFTFDETNLRAAVSVGKPAVVYTEDFTSKENLDKNWTGLEDNFRQSVDQGHRERNALLLGLDDTRPPSDAAGTYVAVSPPVDLRNMSSGAFLTFWHLDKMAKGDGAHVRAQVLLNEKRPTTDASWQPSFAPGPNAEMEYTCLLTPVNGYEGEVYTSNVQPQQNNPTNSTDQNPAYPVPTPGFHPSPKAFFVSWLGVPSSEWELAVVDLSKATCRVTIGGQPVDVKLTDHVVRFQFAMFAGSTGSTMGVNRGPSVGFYVDDVSVGGFNLTVKPEDGQTGLRLLDNTTKTFNVLVRNDGAVTDMVGVRYDARNSTAPLGSVEVPPEPVVLAPGEQAVVPVRVTLPRDPTLLPTEFEVRVRAESLFDLNAGGDTLLKILFAPREWAELRVAVDAPTRGVQEGTESFIPIVVENTGLVASVPSVVEIVDSWTDATTGERRQRTTRLDLPSMSSYFQDADDSRRTIEFVWRPDAGSIGDHTLTFTVDPQVLGQEYTRTNNVVSITAPVVKLLIPDLSLEHADALVLRDALAAPLAPLIDGEVIRYEVTTGELLSFQVKLRNLGAGGVTNVDVRTFIGQLSLPAKTVPFIGPGGEVTVNFNWVAQKGEYPIEIAVRSETVELTTANNRFPTEGVIFLTVKDYEVEVGIDTLDAVLEPGTEVQLPFSLSNTGNAGEEIRLDGSLPEGWSVRFPRAEMYLRAGETYEDVATLVVPDAAVAGEQFISILAVSRENPMKAAAAETTVEVRAFYEGRVLSQVATVTPPSFMLPVRLANDGNSLQPWSVDLQLPAGWTTSEALPLDVSVPPRGETTVDVLVHVPSATPPGLSDVRVNATMPNGESREGKVAVEMTQRRGATVTLASVVPSETRRALTYPVEIANVGNVRQPFSVILMDAPAGVDVTVTPSRFELAPGQTATATLRVAPDATVANGEYGVRLYALFDGVHPDTSEGRGNLHDVQVALARPDLSVLSVEQTPRADVNEGDRVSVRAIVVNNGDAPATNLPVHLYVDDLFVAETRIASIQPGEELAVDLNWTAVGGSHTLMVIVDPYGDKLDATTDDHASAIEANVAGSGPVGPNAAGLVGIPAPGLLGFLVAFAAAVALTTVARRRLAK